jgi:hypothetical protein
LRFDSEWQHFLFSLPFQTISLHGKWREVGHLADAKAADKWRSYRGALERQEDGGLGWLVKGKGATADVFVPFAFEVGGALGKEAEEFLSECTAVAEWKNQGVGDLTLATADRRGNRSWCS